MKNSTYRHIPFVITLPSLAIIWLTSANTNPIWLKHLIFGGTFLLVVVVFLLVSLAKGPKKMATKPNNQKSHYSFIPFMVLAMTIPSIVINILSADLPNLTKVLVLTITPTIAALIFGLTTLIHHRKQKQHEL